MKKAIIVSAVNLVEGGPLTVLQECLRYLSLSDLSKEYEITALVNNKKPCLFKNINYLEIKESKKSWIFRLYYEYYYFGKLAKRFNPFLWLSLHDITPNVTVDRLAIYCHNPSPFYRLSFKEAVLDPRFTLFNIFYKYLYWINIKKNDFVIVQQDWIRQRFKKLYGINNVIVAYPSVSALGQKAVFGKKTTERITFFYPALPRFFKNFEVICDAVIILNARGITDFNVFFTLNGNENRYAQSLARKYGDLKQINFIGRLSRKKVEEYYRNADCLIFPSKLETWGLPITEFKYYNKPMLLSDLDFAHETVGAYDEVAFFDPNDPLQLAKLMEDFMNKRLVFLPHKKRQPEPLFAENWDQLFKILLR